MKAKNYELTDSVAGFDEGDVLDVTARFGDWHVHELKLEASPRSPKGKTVVVTGDTSGFSEAEILDPTARIGDWHTYDLKFDPVGSSDRSVASGQVTLTADEFERVARPVEPTA